LALTGCAWGRFGLIVGVDRAADAVTRVKTQIQFRF
jgi:hypothetical protein